MNATPKSLSAQRWSSTVKPTDIRIDAVEFAFEEFRYRTPIKFGGIASDRVTLVNVHCDVNTRSGKRARGFGSMPLGNVWSFPSRRLTYDDTLAAMQAVIGRIAEVCNRCTEVAHPIDLGAILEPQCDNAAEAVTQERHLAEPIPRLCTLVCYSPFDAALHDAFGKVHGLNCYHTYGPDFMSHDLGHYLGADFAGETLDRYVRREPVPRMPLYHLVGALDPITPADVRQPVGDGLPETLADWIRHDGLTHLKIKLNGDDLGWDVTRVLAVERVAAEVQKERGVSRWCYSLDFNERCPNVGYLLEFLAKVREQAPAGFDRIAYIEQPTARDLRAKPENPMHEAAKLRPIVIDESLLDLQSLQDARALGYTGAALKACKGQGQSLLLGAAAQKFGMFLCVQDLTCPGASLIHSAGLAAHVPGVSAIESNARQFVPAANRPWEERFPGIFRITDGTMQTAVLTGPGLGAVA
jgi:L-alanine-DL-glutamate epimerase-like enolase superfamily enzyme